MISQFRPRALSLSSVALALGAGAALPLGLMAESGSVSVELISPQVIANPSGLDFFSELDYVVYESNLTSEPSNLWFVEQVFTRLEIEENPNSTGEDDEFIETTRFFGNYRAVNTSSRRAGETGFIGWVLDSEEEQSTITGNGVVGFIRADRRPSQFGGESATSYFAGAEGDLSWTQKSASVRQTELSLSGAAYNPSAVLEDPSVTLTVSSSSFSLGGFEFPIAGTFPTEFWQFGSVSLLQVSDSQFAGLVLRTDRIGREAEEGELPIPTIPSAVAVDPDSFWARNYVVILTDTNDQDRDGVPDFLDYTQSLVTFPWYADYDGGDNWYYSVWMNTWIRSDIFSDWDYHLKLGWIYVPLSSDRDGFWMWLNAPATGAGSGWIYTNTSVYPYFYISATGDWRYYWVDGAGNAAFYQL
jgi:hypothetical protein